MRSTGIIFFLLYSMSRELTTKMEALDREFNGSIESLVSIYPMYKLNPESRTYSSSYADSNGRLSSVSAGFHSLQAQARNKITTLNSSIQSLDRRIRDLTEENSRLKERSYELVGAKQSSTGQAAAYQSLYRQHIFSAAALVGTGAVMVAKMF